MKDNYKNKILVLTILTIVFTIMGSTLAFWNWNTSEAQKTLIGFTVDRNLSCTGDGGGNITSSEKNIVPTSCTNQTYAIQRTITLNTSSTISTNDLFLDLWLDVVNLGEGLSNSQNFKYALTRDPNSCTTNVVSQGTFNGKTNGSKVDLIGQKQYLGTNTDTYYLYIWLDSAEESQSTMNQSFELKLGGKCDDDLGVERVAMYSYNGYEAPVIPKYNNLPYQYMVKLDVDSFGLPGEYVLQVFSTNKPFKKLETDNFVVLEGEDIEFVCDTYLSTDKLLAIATQNGVLMNRAKIWETTESSDQQNYDSMYSILEKNFGATSLWSNYNILNENSSIYFEKTESMFIEYKNKPSAPVLDNAGMIPVTIDNSGNVTTVAETDPNWYSYEDKKWANAILVTEGSRANYLNKPNTPVTKNDILAYYVWIPRFKYTMPYCFEIENPNVEEHPTCYNINISEEDKATLITYTHSHVFSSLSDYYSLDDVTNLINDGLITGRVIMQLEEMILIIPILYLIESVKSEYSVPITYTTEFNGYNQHEGPGTINVEFENKASSKSTGNGIGRSYRTHPAFTFGNKELNGIWVGKFETTGTAEHPTILNGFLPLEGQNISSQFQTSLKFAGGSMNLTTGKVTFTNSSTYGLSNVSDSHMMKNSEWGAVAYLSHSKYGTCTDGVCQEVRHNNTGQTGCGAATADADESQTCTLAYGSGISEYPQSTTGNITGVFDMSGGSAEYVMGVLADDNGKPRSGHSIEYNSGFNGMTKNDGEYTNGINFPESKYYDLYTSNYIYKSCAGGRCYGHALDETYEWYSDSRNPIDLADPWYLRSGDYDSGSRNEIEANGIFKFLGEDGYNDSFYNYSWRSVLVVD